MSKPFILSDMPVRVAHTVAASLRRRGAAALALMAMSVCGAGAHAAVASPVDEARQYLRGSSSVAVNLPKAFSLFNAAAKAGDPLAAYYLGMMYRNGMAAPRDARAAARWLQFAANRQMPAAMFMLAKLYLSGEGVPRDDQAARRLIEKAADLDYPEAVMTMAIGLRDGSMGFERNEALSEAQMRFATQAMQRSAPE